MQCLVHSFDYVHFQFPERAHVSVASHGYGAIGGVRIASSRSRNRGMKNSLVSVVS